MKQLKLKIAKNEKMVPGFFKMRIISPYLAKASKPGQFITVRCEDDTDPLLRRPFGIHRILPDGIEALYEVKGKGTEILSRKRSGDDVDILGPLGNGFDLQKMKGKRPVIIAGGIGVAPMVAVAESIGASDVIIGARTKGHILCEKDFKKLGSRVIIATDDGSRGIKGLSTDALKDLLKKSGDEERVIFACGPNPMLKAVWNIAGPLGIECQFSFEEHMACGVGACLGCPIKVKESGGHEYKMICKDGPVFRGERIAW